MKCSIIIGTLMADPVHYLTIGGEELFESTLSIRGKDYKVVGYKTAFSQTSGKRVKVTGYVKAHRQQGKLQTFYMAIRMEEAGDNENDTSEISVTGTLVKRAPDFTIEEGMSREVITAIIQYKDSEGKYNLVHMVCKGKQAREMLEINAGREISVKGIFLRRATVYELLVKEIELIDEKEEKVND